MNKQRKVLITITYNEMGIIIDTNAEEVAQPFARDINVLTTEPRMKGKWVNRRMSGKTCSICGYDYDCKGTDSENFCPNCGARMVET